MLVSIAYLGVSLMNEVNQLLQSSALNKCDTYCRIYRRLPAWILLPRENHLWNKASTGTPQEDWWVFCLSHQIRKRVPCRSIFKFANQWKRPCSDCMHITEVSFFMTLKMLYLSSRYPAGRICIEIISALRVSGYFKCMKLSLRV